CRLILQTLVKEWVALRSSVTPSVGPVIGGHLGNKSIRDISWLLNIPRSTVSGIITKWKQLGTTATQPPRGRPRHMTGRGQRMLKRTVRRSRQLSAEPIAKDLQTWCGLQMSPTTFVGRVWGWSLPVPT
ncbi:unnamed protein product, partial [Staurois parvus]